MVPFWVLNIMRHLVFRGLKKDHNFDNHQYAAVPYWIHTSGAGVLPMRVMTSLGWGTRAYLETPM